MGLHTEGSLVGETGPERLGVLLPQATTYRLARLLADDGDLPVPDDLGRLVAALLVEVSAARLREPEELVTVLWGGVRELTLLLT